MNSAIIIVTEVTSFAVCSLSTCVAADFKETYLATRHSRSRTKMVMRNTRCINWYLHWLTDDNILEAEPIDTQEMLFYERNGMFELKNNLYFKIQSGFKNPICLSVYLYIFSGFVLVQDYIFTVPVLPSVNFSLDIVYIGGGTDIVVKYSRKRLGTMARVGAYYLFFFFLI